MPLIAIQYEQHTHICEVCRQPYDCTRGDCDERSYFECRPCIDADDVIW
jgi:hypothetical protein